MAARVAHNHKVAGSSPAPATKINRSPKGGLFILVLAQDTNLRQIFFKEKYRSCRDGGARTRAGACTEHAAAEKDEVRCPAPIRA